MKILFEHTRKPHLASSLIATSVGTILEWYDFMIFAFLIPFISQLFFPGQNKLVTLMEAYSVFAIGFLMRPVGAMIFGHFGDKFGRKKVLVFSIVCISFATTLMGCLPTYTEVGVLAPIMLIVLRLIQGLCIGGETTGAACFVLELGIKENRGIIGSMMWASVGIGMLIGSLVTTLLIAYMNPKIFLDWGWRIPFLFGILTGLAGYFLRKNRSETLLFEHAKKEKLLVTNPLSEAFTKHKNEIGKISGLYMLSAIITYLIFVFMPTYLKTIGITSNKTNLISTLAIACVTLLVPFAGYLSDRIGRKPCLLIASLGFMVCSYPLYLIIDTYRSMGSAFYYAS